MEMEISIIAVLLRCKTLFVPRCYGDIWRDSNLMLPTHSYAFDVVYHDQQLFLTNRRVFAMADNGVPDGIKCQAIGLIREIYRTVYYILESTSAKQKLKFDLLYNIHGIDLTSCPAMQS